MKKVLRFLLILIVILASVYLILCLTGPSEMSVQDSTTINAPKAVVWNQVVNLKHWDNWSPWKEQDSTVKTTTSGPDGQPGNVYNYDSKKSGSGSMTITAINGDTMFYDMHFITPFENDAKGWISVVETGEGVLVTHTFNGPVSFIMRGGAVLMGGQQMLEHSFDRGLEMLKEYSEAHKDEAGHMVEAATFPATTFATIRKTISMNEIMPFFEQNTKELGSKAGDKITGRLHAITYKWDEANGQADVAVAFPVSGPVEGATMFDLPESKGYMLKYTGPYSGFYNAHMVISKHAMENGLTDPLVIEDYVVAAPQETDTNKFVTHIYYLHK